MRKDIFGESPFDEQIAMMVDLLDSRDLSITLIWSTWFGVKPEPRKVVSSFFFA